MILNKHEEFIKKVKEQVGDEYTFKGEYRYAREKIPVIHNKCGHCYSVTPDNFLGVNQRRCPKCAIKKKKQSIPFTQEEFENIIYDIVGNEYTVLSEYKGQDEKFLIKHNKCGTIYKTSYRNFRRGRRCNKCKDDKRRKPKEQFEKEVKLLGEGDYEVVSDYVNHKTKVTFRHTKCNKEFAGTPDNFLRGNRCPHCKASKGEHKIMKYLENNSFDYDTQVVFKDLKDNHPLRFDFSIKTPNNFILIEYDGIQHFEPVKHWGGEEGLRRNQLRDKMKNDYVREKGYKLIRIPYWEFDNIEEILNEELKGDL